MKNFLYTTLGLMMGIVITFSFVGDKCRTPQKALANVRCEGDVLSSATQNKVTGEIVISCGQSSRSPVNFRTNSARTIDLI